MERVSSLTCILLSSPPKGLGPVIPKARNCLDGDDAIDPVNVDGDPDFIHHGPGAYTAPVQWNGSWGPQPVKGSTTVHAVRREVCQEVALVV